MKGKLAVFDKIKGHTAAAYLREGVLDDLMIDPPHPFIRPGTIYRARVARPMKGQGGVFLETPDGPLFLRNAKGFAQGATVLVMTTTFPDRGKAIPATQRLLFKGRFCIVTPDAPGLNISRSIRDEERRVELREIAAGIVSDERSGLILRSACLDADDDAIRSDVHAMLDVARDILAEGDDGAPERLLDGPDAEELAYREWPVPDSTDAEDGSFERHGVLDTLVALAKGEVALGASGRMFVEATRALVAVDVDTGGDASPGAGLKTNIEAVRALPRTLRILGLGGQIVVDVAPMPKRDRAKVEQQIAAAFRADTVETSFVGWTPLGHAELQRKRERLPIAEVVDDLSNL